MPSTIGITAKTQTHPFPELLFQGLDVRSRRLWVIRCTIDPGRRLTIGRRCRPSMFPLPPPRLVGPVGHSVQHAESLGELAEGPVSVSMSFSGGNVHAVVVSHITNANSIIGVDDTSSSSRVRIYAWPRLASTVVTIAAGGACCFLFAEQVSPGCSPGALWLWLRLWLMMRKVRKWRLLMLVEGLLWFLRLGLLLRVLVVVVVDVYRIRVGRDAVGGCGDAEIFGLALLLLLLVWWW